jgi:uncharacterized delta-60 repeat protein
VNSKTSTSRQRWIPFVSAVLIGVIAASPAQLARAAAGDLDPAFGVDGKVLPFFQTSVSQGINDVALQADGKIVVTGFAPGKVTGVSTNVFSTRRYNTDGSLDPSFGPIGPLVGTVRDAFPDTVSSTPEAVAIQSDGKIVVAGRVFEDISSSDGSSRNIDFGVIRYHADGTRDASFGVDGLVRTDFANSLDEAFSVAIQSDGKIVVAGRSGRRFEFPSVAIARYNVDGTLDTSFSGDGLLIGSPVFAVDDVVIQDDGKIVIGAATVFPNIDFAVLRFLPDGLPDRTFGDTGIATVDLDRGTDVTHSLVVQDDGRIVLAGDSFASKGGPARSFVVARFDQNGVLDSSFGGGDGFVVERFGANAARADDIALQTDGKIVAMGTVGNNAFVVARYSRDGVIDQTFGIGGSVRIDFETPAFRSTADFGTSVAIQADGKIVAAGTSTDLTGLTFGSDGALARIQAVP